MKFSLHPAEAKTGEFAAWYSNSHLAAWDTMCASESQSFLAPTTSINQRGSAAQLSSGWEPDSLSCHLRRAAGIFLAWFAWLTILFAQNNARAQDGPDLEKQLQETEAALAQVDNYTAVFHRIERVDGKLVPEQITLLKFKRPFKVYMKWISPFKGQESLYVEGANNNKVRAHGTGFAGLITVNLDPTGGLAMKDSRHPVTEAGLEILVKKIGSNLRRGLRAGELTSKDHGERTVYGRKTREMEGILPKDPAKGYYCYRCIVNLDVETRMPIKTRIFDWQDQLVESYGYEHLSLNPGLSDKDFDPKNPGYHF
ncbi:MAG TPA: DUF1571 domain-containing protein [Verrucomicrobiae bacterium]|nr:DUF1571 domain-containing protein [Verrucomicrobiae bacterium]